MWGEHPLVQPRLSRADPPRLVIVGQLSGMWNYDLRIDRVSARILVQFQTFDDPSTSVNVIMCVHNYIEMLFYEQSDDIKQMEMG